MSTVREILTKYCESEGFEANEGNLIELLTEADVVHESDFDKHRWYIEKTSVAKIDDSFIAYTDYVITGDSCMSDMDLEYDLDTARVVKRKEREIIEVYYE